MKILFDQGVPAPLRRCLAEHEVFTAYEKSWSILKNGDLIKAAESEGFQVMVTTDQSLRYQQNLDGRKIAIAVLSSTSWPKIQRAEKEVRVAINGISLGQYLEIPV